MSSPEQLPRVRLRESAGGDEELALVYDQVSRAAGGVPRLYQALGAAPPLLRGWIDFAWALRADARSSRALRELAILRCAQLCGSEYIWRSHVRLALKVGVTEEQIAALARNQGARGADDVLSPLEQAVLTLVGELVHGTVTDATWAGTASYLDERAMVELVLTISWYAHVARVVDALGVPLEDHHAGVPPLPSADRKE